MKNFIVALVLLIGLASCQESIKIGYVDNAKIVDEYQEKKDVEAKLQEKINAFEKKRDSLGKAWQLEIQEAQMKAQKMSQTELQKLQQEFQQKEQLISQKIQFDQQQLSSESQAQNDTLIKKIKSFVKKYGKDNGYTYILGSNEGGSVMYGNEALDVTDEVIKELNTSYSKK